MPHRSASLIDKTLLVKNIELNRCALIALPQPRVYYDIIFSNKTPELSVALPKSWRCSESEMTFESSRGRRSSGGLSSTSGGLSNTSGALSKVSGGLSRGSGGTSRGSEVVRWGGRPGAVTRASRGPATDLYVELPPSRNHFSGFGKSYHFSCVSPFQFTYPYVVYI